MALDKKLLARAKTALDERRHAHEKELENRISAVYRANPRVRELDRELRLTMTETMSLMLAGGNSDEKLERLRDKNLALQAERSQELIRAGFSGDYLDGGYLCEKCRDTGYEGTHICSCLRELYAEEQRRSLSSLLRLGDETFDSFSLSWYDTAADPTLGVSPRENMEYIFEFCRLYAEKFGGRSKNLIFSGPTGLGKTFLSACIARVVSEKGFSVVYETAGALFARFEESRFDRGDAESAREAVRRYMEAELLIIDDLGTEMTTSFTVSAMYELVNTRLTSGKRTIINTNLTRDELKARYSPQIFSRLDGEYQLLRFFGDDIRLRKKELEYSL
ncbi:MAG: ATP-binding protein [Oscillospiraceae bacterium]|nr:ATP-binding protein [Oscillospiraceae bacterium]